jgi:membrane protease YdiL (CAAX protease family)
MSETMMDNKPLSPSPAEPEPSLSAEDAKAPAASLYPSSSPESRSAVGPNREFPLREVFLGTDGIYPGVRWLIYLGMGWIIYQLEGWLLFSLRSSVGVLWWSLMIEGTRMLAATLPAAIMARIEGVSFGDFGLPARSAFGRNFWVGALWGIGSLSVLMLALRGTGAFEFGSLALHGVSVWKFAAYYAVLFLLTGFFEDFLMRGYSQWVLAQGMGFWPAAALLSFAFGYIHSGNAGEAMTGLVAAGLIGFFLCLTLRRTGTLWWAVGFHMAWDWGESYFYSVSDSGTLLPRHLLDSSMHGPDWLTGGSVGPEGSYLVFAVIGALWVMFDRLYPNVKYRVQAHSQKSMPHPSHTLR